MAGILYGIGVGPGDPELLTLKAVRIIRMCDLILVPGSSYQKSVAYQIAVQAVPEMDEKEIRSIVMPMTRDQSELEKAHRLAAEQIIKWLDAGRCIGLLNLGDVTLYSTYVYIHRQIIAAGYQAEMISGVPSFCAAAARLNIGLANGAEPLHILPVPEQIEEGIRLPGTKIIMKMGSHIGAMKAQLLENGIKASMVENCGIPGEKIYKTTDEIPEDAGYYSLVIVKEQG